jgi:hypothetical protein
MIDGTWRAVPPISWENASLRQIREHLNTTESEEDVYRVVDQLGEWVSALEDHLTEHERHWNAVSDSCAGEAHTAAVAHSAQTRAELVRAVTDLRDVQSSLDSLTATFVDVRGRVERLYQDDQSAREPMLGWVLAQDDEPNEMTRRDNAEWARQLMRQYEEITNDELSRWPDTETSPAGTPPAALIGTADTVPIRDGGTFGDDSPTKPTRANDIHTSPAGAGGAAPPGQATGAGDGELARDSFSWPEEDQLFDANVAVSPSVIDAGFEFEKDEGDGW